VEAKDPEALCRELTAIQTLSLMGPGSDEEASPVTLSEFLKRAKDALSEELAELRRAALETLVGIWEDVVSELRGLFPGSTPGTTGGGGGVGGGIGISAFGEEIDWSDVQLKFSGKGARATIELWRSEDLRQVLRCDVNCLYDGAAVNANLIYRNQLARGVEFKAVAYSGADGSGISLTLSGGF
jgi:hypothetical protein